MAYEKIAGAIEALDQATTKLDEALRLYNEGKDELQKAPLEVLLRAYVRLDQSHDRVESSRKDFNKELTYLSGSKIPERLQLARVKNQTIMVGNQHYLVTVGYRFAASMIDPEKAITYLKAGDENARALVKETVNAKTLASYAKDLMEDAKELPDDLFKVGSVPYTSVRAK